jgi:thiol-disulfide isomerase/thioredoxin
MRWFAATIGALALASIVVGSVVRFHTPMAELKSCALDQKDAAHVFKPAKLDFTLKNMQGENVALSSYNGKVLVLDFWATWCGPCKVEIPAFVELQKKYAASGLQIVGISIDDTAAELEPYVKDMKMNYPVLVGKGHDDVQDAYGPLVGIPVSVVIARDGKVCASHPGLTGKDEFEREIKALL